MDIPSIARPVVVPEVVTALEDLLAQARRGEFRSMICFKFGELQTNQIGHFVAGNVTLSEGIFAFEMYKHQWIAKHLAEQGR